MVGKFLRYYEWVEDLLPSYYEFLIIFLVFEIYYSNDDSNSSWVQITQERLQREVMKEYSKFIYMFKVEYLIIKIEIVQYVLYVYGREVIDLESQ